MYSSIFNSKNTNRPSFKSKSMTEIVRYKSALQNGIDAMMYEIALEFNSDIIPKATRETPIVPDQYWVAMNAKRVIGTIGILNLKNDVGVLKKMMLKKEYRGKEYGVSKKLLNTAITWCKLNNIFKLYLGTMEQFKAAQSFYKKNGFEQISKNDLPNNFLLNPLDRIFFVLDLNK